VPSARSEHENNMLLEIGIVAISVVGFVLLDLYVLGCEKV
jgi:hypothetical protein